MPAERLDFRFIKEFSEEEIAVLVEERDLFVCHQSGHSGFSSSGRRHQGSTENRSAARISSSTRVEFALRAQRAPPGPGLRLPPALGWHLGRLFRSISAESTLSTAETASSSPRVLTIAAGEFNVAATT